MAKVRIEFLKEGMVLGEDQYAPNGQSLLPAKSRLTEESIRKLSDNGKVFIEIEGLNDEELEKLYTSNATADQRTKINQLHKAQFSLCVEEDRYVQELQKISMQSLYISLRL